MLAARWSDKSELRPSIDWRTRVTSGAPLNDEKANVAIANPRTRCIITPFIVPASLRGKLKNQH
jgi:hypothetical protein